MQFLWHVTQFLAILIPNVSSALRLFAPSERNRCRRDWITLQTHVTWFLTLLLSQLLRTLDAEWENKIFFASSRVSETTWTVSLHDSSQHSPTNWALKCSTKMKSADYSLGLLIDYPDLYFSNNMQSAPNIDEKSTEDHLGSIHHLLLLETRTRTSLA